MRKKILINISTLFIRRLIVRNFENNKDVEITDTFMGKEALKLLTNEKFNLLITDYNLYDFEGDKFVQEVRKHDLTLPVMVLASNKARLEKIERMNNIIPFLKPVDFEIFNTTLSHILKLNLGK